MFLGLVLIASIPAYIAGFVALIMGMGWLASLGVVMVTGTVLLVLSALLLTYRDMGASPAPELRVATR